MTPIPKPTPKLIDKKKARADVAAIDRRENAKVKQRSGGLCEVQVRLPPSERRRVPGELPVAAFTQCLGVAVGEPHHLISGIGRRNVGKSILAAHKLAVCRKCHLEIHGHVLKPENEAHRYDAATIRFIRYIRIS